MTKPILLVGGYGVLGATIARTLRAMDRSLPICIAGRDGAKARAFASTIGNASGLDLDLAAPERVLREADFSAVAILVKDDALRLTDLACRLSIPVITLSSGAFEIGTDLFHGLRAARNAPLVIASHWFAGACTLLAMSLADRLREVRTIEVGVLVDRTGAPSGPATSADFDRISAACPAKLLRRRGRYEWVHGDDARGEFTASDGTVVRGTIAVSCDVLSLTAATGAGDVRVIEAFAKSASAQLGLGPSDEVVATVSGTSGKVGKTTLRRRMTAHLESSPLTAITVALAIMRVIGEGEAPPVSPGVRTIEEIFDPETFLGLLRRLGVEVSEVETVPS